MRSQDSPTNSRIHSANPVNLLYTDGSKATLSTGAKRQDMNRFHFIGRRFGFIARRFAFIARRLSSIVILSSLFGTNSAIAATPSNLLPTGQRLTPAGFQISLTGTLPLNAILLSNGTDAVINCSGLVQGLSVVDLRRGAEVQFVADQMAADGTHNRPGAVFSGSHYYGLALSLDGKTLFASEGALDAVGIYAVDRSAHLSRIGEIPIPSADPKTKNLIAGIALSPDGSTLYAACLHSDRLAIVNLPRFETENLSNYLTFLQPPTIGGYPLVVAVSPKSGTVYVTSERDGTVTAVDPKSLSVTATIPTGADPDALTFSRDGASLWVSNGDSDTVSCIDTQTNKVVSETLLRPDESQGLPSVSPEGLLISPDGGKLYVALADLNAVAILDVSRGGSKADLAGYISAGWYPAAVMAPAGCNRIYVLNAKGSSAVHQNPKGPGAGLQGDNAKYILGQLTGSLSAIPVKGTFNTKEGTHSVLVDNALAGNAWPNQAEALARIQSLPIKHVLYIIKENRTYDQVLGDLGEGNGAPSLALFGAAVTPNEHAISKQFTLLDNFYCCAEVSADGWNWSASGYASPYTQRTVPEYYREATTRWIHKVNPASIPMSGQDYDFEGENHNVAVSLQGTRDVAESPGGYIWDLVANQGLTYRNFGCFLRFSTRLPTKKALVGHTDPDFMPFDLDYADSDAWVKLGVPSPGKPTYGAPGFPSRFAAWKADFDRSVADHDLPAFEIIRLPRDHTSGTTPGEDTPQAMVADNDYAVGEVVDAVSHSSYWKDTAIFVVEDDAQDGPDHVDCHRSTAYIVSAYTRRGYVDHHFYNTDSILRSMEAFLRLPSMTRFDQTAPLLQLFTERPDLSAYSATLPAAVVFQKNGTKAYGSALSRKMNFAEADDIDESVLNQVLWHAIKGANSPYPTVRHSLK